MKTCTQCQRELPLDAFHKKGQYVRQPCKECRNANNHQEAMQRVAQGIEARNARETKVCTRCHEELPIERFYPYPTPSNPNYRWASCKSCNAKLRSKLRIAQHARDPEAKKRDDAIKHASFLKNIEKVRAYLRAYKRQHPEQRQESFARWRARIKNAPVVEKIDRKAIYERDRWICQLCFKKVKRKDASLDHVIPLARGGSHTRQNLVLVHLWCNSQKGARNVTQQMRLF